MVIVQQVVLSPLGHATQYADDQRIAFGALFLLALAALGVECLKTVEYLLFGIVAHRTGVEENCIGIVESLCGFVTSHLHNRGYNLGICHVHLAAISFNI